MVPDGPMCAVQKNSCGVQMGAKALSHTPDRNRVTNSAIGSMRGPSNVAMSSLLVVLARQLHWVLAARHNHAAGRGSRSGP